MSEYANGNLFLPIPFGYKLSGSPWYTHFEWVDQSGWGALKIKCYHVTHPSSTK